jgi:acetyl esterase/lipase
MTQITTGIQNLSRRCFLLLVCWTVCVLGSLPASAATWPTEANVMVEIPLKSERDHADPFNTVTVDVDVTDPAGRLLRVPAFWAGGKEWRVRYASPLPGTHRYRSRASDAADGGLHGSEGTIEVRPYSGNNPLLRHGPLRAAADRRHLEHADGTPFFWLGDTWWMGLCQRLRWPDEFQQLAADRKAKGYNVVQIVAGLYPDMPAFDPRGANEAGFPWEKDYARIRPEYFDAADRRLKHLVDQGFTPCIGGAWGYFLPWMGVEKAKQHWRYVIARYGAMPVVWCVAGEANLPWYLAKGFPYDDRRQVRGWTEVIRHVRATDPFHRPVTIHPTAIGQYTSRHATDDAALLDFDMLQTPHGQREAVPITVKAVRDSYAARPTLPVINGEASYEMLSDSLPTRWTRTMFWLCMTNGAAGHTYGANGIWQCNRKDQPHGASPHGGTYGKITWDEAMRLPGSEQLALGKRFFDRYPWHRFQPHPEWAEWAAAWELSLDNCSWIWYPEGNAAKDAPVAKRYFRRTFALPEGKAVAEARLRVSADDSCSVRLNGRDLGVGNDRQNGTQFAIARWLKPGENVLAIAGENMPANVPANPAGLLFRLEVRLADGQTIDIVSDAQTRSFKDEVAGWSAAGFDGDAWAKAMVVGRHGDAPWGKIGGASDAQAGPQATGIPGIVRVVYAPDSRPIVLRGLGAGTLHTAAYFDPVKGTHTAIGEIRASADGTWRCPPPKGTDEDWVLVVEPQAPPKAAQTKPVSREGVEYLARLRKNTPFGTNDFDLKGLREGMGSRREPSMKDVRLIRVKIGEMSGEWVLAPGADPEIRLLYLHGGGFVSGSGGFYLTLAAHLSAAARCAVLLPDYRLAPEHPFPAGLEDCVRAHEWMLANGPSGAARAKATFIAGDSAGGNLTLATLLALRDRRRPLPAGGISLSPTTDLTLASESLKTVEDPILSARSMPVFRDLYLGKADPRNPLASPVFGDYRGIPPLLVQAGEHEMLRDDSVRVAKKARADGVSVKLEVWPGMFHVFQSHEPLLPEAREAIDHAAEFIRSLAKSHSGQ